MISDFGIAYRIDAEEGAVGIDVETPHMAPEQFRRQDAALGPWTDFYALGCMCYWLCTGVAPFVGQSMAELAVQHLKHVPRALTPSFPVPSEFKEWVANCLAKPTSERPQLAADAAYELNRVAGGDDDSQTA